MLADELDVFEELADVVDVGLLEGVERELIGLLDDVADGELAAELTGDETLVRVEDGAVGADGALDPAARFVGAEGGKHRHLRRLLARDRVVAPGDARPADIVVEHARVDAADAPGLEGLERLRPLQGDPVDVFEDLVVGLERGCELGAGIGLGGEQLRVTQARREVF